jgi:hypothetical protein
MSFRLRRSAEALFGAGALDDLLTVAVKHGGPRLPVLVPEIVDPLVQLLELGGDLGLVALFGQDVPQLGSTGGGTLDLSSYVVQISHRCIQRLNLLGHSLPPAAEGKREDEKEANDEACDRDNVEKNVH